MAPSKAANEAPASSSKHHVDSCGRTDSPHFSLPFQPAFDVRPPSPPLPCQTVNTARPARRARTDGLHEQVQLFLLDREQQRHADHRRQRAHGTSASRAPAATFGGRRRRARAPPSTSWSARPSAQGQRAPRRRHHQRGRAARRLARARPRPPGHAGSSPSPWWITSPAQPRRAAGQGRQAYGRRHGAASSSPGDSRNCPATALGDDDTTKQQVARGHALGDPDLVVPGAHPPSAGSRAGCRAGRDRGGRCRRRQGPLLGAEVRDALDVSALRRHAARRPRRSRLRRRRRPPSRAGHARSPPPRAGSGSKSDSGGGSRHEQAPVAHVRPRSHPQASAPNPCVQSLHLRTSDQVHAIQIALA